MYMQHWARFPRSALRALMWSWRDCLADEKASPEGAAMTLFTY